MTRPSAVELTREEKLSRVDTLVRGTAQLFVPWTIAVRLPAAAITLGACTSSSFWWLLPGGLALLTIAASPGAGLLTLLASIPVYLFSHQPWFAVFLVVLGMVPFIESEAHYAEMSRQAADVLADILTEDSRYVLKEIEVPQQILKAFYSYELKAKRADVIRRYAQTFNLPNLLAYRTAALRAFQFRPRDSTGATGAAVAFPFDRYSSLIFLRQSFEKLTDAQWLQLYHELAHGTADGRKIVLRRFLWAKAEKISALSTLLFFGVVMYRIAYHPTSTAIWGSLAALIFANYLRYLCAQNVKLIAIAASEVMADSMALTTPQFRADDRWPIRANNLLLRLEDDLKKVGPDSPRAFDLMFRIRWLRVWLNRQKVGVYLGTDIDVRLHGAFVLYLIAGALANLPLGLASWLVWILVPLTLLISWATFAINAKLTEVTMKNVDERLSRALAGPSVFGLLRTTGAAAVIHPEPPG